MNDRAVILGFRAAAEPPPRTEKCENHICCYYLKKNNGEDLEVVRAVVKKFSLSASVVFIGADSMLLRISPQLKKLRTFSATGSPGAGMAKTGGAFQ